MHDQYIKNLVPKNGEDGVWDRLSARRDLEK